MISEFIDWNKLDTAARTNILQRPVANCLKTLRKKTAAIIVNVKLRGDIAVREYTQQFDQVEINQFAVSDEEFQTAKKQVPKAHQQAIELAINQLQTFHQAQFPHKINVTTCPGVVCQREAKPILRVGLYVPGGSAPLVSTVMMLAIPAKIANCPLRVLVTPPQKDGNINPHILLAAELCGIEKIYKVGGAQAIAALAYGTESIPKVDKIFGPGNSWVTQAKLLVAQDVNGATYDLPAGPSELLVIADQSSHPDCVAADLLSQAEHGPDSQVILLTPSVEIAKQIAIAVKNQLAQLPRKTIAKRALQQSHIIIVESIQQAITISNQYAPEHLILNIEHASLWANEITCAGAVFVGAYAAETLGDYITGANHVLPTEGYARNMSGLSVSDFMTFINFQTIDAQGFDQLASAAEILADIEGLYGHKNAVSLRRKFLEKIDV